MPRRLLFIVNEALFFTTHRMPIGLAMRDAGFDVHVAAPDEPEPRAKIEAAGLTFHPIPLHRGTRNPLGELKLVFAIAALTRRLQPDLVHHVAMKPVVWGGLATRLLGVPASVFAITGLGYMFIRHGLMDKIQRRILRWLYRFALHHPNSRAIFQNPDDLDLFRRLGLVEPERITMIRGCGVDMEEFRATLEPPLDEQGRITVMFPARLLGDKGIHEFIHAARVLTKAGLKARFVLVGRTDPKNPTDAGEAAVRGWINEGIVDWWGYATDMPATLARAHLICMPSYREGLPRGLIEAAACQRAIVTTDVPGCREVVHHEVNGLLVPAQDGPATAEALRRLIENADERARFAAAGRAMAVAEFSVQKFIADSLAVYRAVLPKETATTIKASS